MKQDKKPDQQIRCHSDQLVRVEGGDFLLRHVGKIEDVLAPGFFDRVHEQFSAPGDLIDVRCLVGDRQMTIAQLFVSQVGRAI